MPSATSHRYTRLSPQSVSRSQAVRAFRGGGETEQETRLEPGNHSPVALRGGGVELVDEDVIEAFGVEPLQVRLAAQRLNGREQHVRVRRLVLASVVAEGGGGANRAERAHGLREDLFPVGDEQHPLGLRALRIEGAEPGLAEAGGEDDQAGGVAGGTRRLEGRQRLLLDRMRLEGRADGLGEDTHNARRGGSLRWLYASTQSVSILRTCGCRQSSSNACTTSRKPLPSLLVTTR